MHMVVLNKFLAERSHTQASPTTIMSDVFSLELDTPAYKGTVTLNTGLFIDGKFVEPVEKGSKIEYVLISLESPLSR